MAEAAVQRSPARFFCHQCAQEVNPVLPDYLCSRCHSGFIEELTQENTRLNNDEMEEENPFNQASEVWNFINTFRRGETIDQAHESLQENWAQPGPSSGGRQDERPNRSNGQDSELNRMPRGEGFIVNILQSLMDNTGILGGGSSSDTGNFPVFVNLHGNPGDYAWGRLGWNAIITQLISQLDGTGPPPLPREKIDEIPTVNITQEQVDKSLQCTVCMEDFIIDEPVRLLSCQHHFHNDCIIPWLELHGTCPICRKVLTDDSGRNLFDASDTSFIQDQTLEMSQASDFGSERTNPNDSYRTRTPELIYSPTFSPTTFNADASTYDFDEDCD